MSLRTHPLPAASAAPTRSMSAGRRRPPAARAARWLGLAVALPLAACGGGDDGGDGGSGDEAVIGATASESATQAARWSSGVNTGLGLLVVNGQRYDAQAATVRDEDGTALDAASLAPGMVVDVVAEPASAADDAGREAPAATATATATATEVTVRRLVEGPVRTVSPDRRRFTVLGQTVQVNDSTVYDDLRRGLGSLAVGDRVEVYGLRADNGRIVATRVEREDRDDDDAPRLVGPVSRLDASAQTFRVGRLRVHYGDATSQPATLANDALVRVTLADAPDAQGRWTARSVRLVTAAPSQAAVQASLEGLITTFRHARSFEVDGVSVDASAAAVLPRGLAAGRRVEIDGRLSDGTLHATTVELEGRDDDASDDDPLELKGTITAVQRNPLQFALRGATVDASSARFEDVRPDRLQVGQTVEVQGRLAADGSTVVASVVELDD